MKPWLWWRGLAESASGESLETGCRFCVDASVAVKTFSHLIYFLINLIYFVLSMPYVEIMLQQTVLIFGTTVNFRQLRRVILR
jgi:hypothetical protein